MTANRKCAFKDLLIAGFMPAPSRLALPRQGGRCELHYNRRREDLGCSDHWRGSDRFVIGVAASSCECDGTGGRKR